MIYNIAELVAFARSRDNRLEDVITYPTAKMEQLLEEAFAVAQDIRPIFAAHETYDLYENVVTDGLREMEIILTKEPQSIRQILDYDTVSFNVTVTSNNHVLVKLRDNVTLPTTYTISINYFFYPLMPLTTIELSVDSYRLLKEAIGAVVCAELRDYEQENYHRTKAKQLAVESTYDLEKGTLDVPVEALWDGSWV